MRGKNFYGREEEQRLILDTLENVPRGQKQDLVVLGPRRIGKSSLLYRLFDLLQAHPDFVPVYIDVQNIKPREMRPLFLKILFSIQNEFRQKGLENQLPAFDTLNQQPDPLMQFLIFNEDMNNLNQIISANSLPRLVLMFDEVELLLEFGGRDTLDWLRSLIQSLNNCIFIVAGSDQLYSLTQDYGSPFYNIFKTIELFSLTSEAARTLIEKPTSEIGLQIPSQYIDLILDATGQTPYFIQGITHYLVEELNRQQRRQANLSDVQKIIAESIQFLSPQFNYLWNTVSQTQQIILFALTKCSDPQAAETLISQMPSLRESMPSPQQRRDIFEDLRQQQILRFEQADRYWFTIPLFVDWIQTTIEDTEIIELASLGERVQISDRELAVTLYKRIPKYFSQEELRMLAFDLGIDLDELSSRGNTTAMARQLVDYLRRHQRLDEMQELLIKERPQVNWPNL
ncbi:MAG: ATP-binding protein [Chloroflexi bacterium]|nr:ATP-binding protein [Chloroflexota bacterium]